MGPVLSMDSMRVVLIQSVVVAGSILAFVTLAVVVNRALRETREALDRRRRRRLEPLVLDHLRTSPKSPLPDVLPKPRSRRDRRIVEQILLEAADTAKDERRRRVTAALEQTGSVRHSVGRLRSRRWWKRAEIAEKLGRMRSREAVEPLIGMMNDPDPEVRLRAARALGLISGGTSIRPLVSALADPSRFSAIRVAEILVNVGEKAVDQMLEAYDSLPPHARVAALDVLGRIRSPRAASLMRRCLFAAQPDVRARAAHGLGLLGDSTAVPDLIRALGDPEWPVRAMAAKGLGAMADPSIVPALGRAMRDRQWWVRRNAGEALRRLGLPGLEALADLLHDSDPFARHMAVTQIEEGRVIDAFVADLTSADAARRAAALRFVDKVTAAAGIDEKTRKAAGSAQDSVRMALSQILRPAARPPQEGRA